MEKRFFFSEPNFDKYSHRGTGLRNCWKEEFFGNLGDWSNTSPPFPDFYQFPPTEKKFGCVVSDQKIFAPLEVELFLERRIKHFE